MTEQSERYPLWCVDRGYHREEHRYVGPFESESEATERRGDGTVRRCRRVLASEVDGIGWAFDRLEEELDDQARGGEIASVLPEAWGDWEDEVVTARDGAREAFREFVDRWFTVDAFVCEGDEPVERPRHPRCGVPLLTRIDTADWMREKPAGEGEDP